MSHENETSNGLPIDDDIQTPGEVAEHGQTAPAVEDTAVAPAPPPSVEDMLETTPVPDVGTSQVAEETVTGDYEHNEDDEETLVIMTRTGPNPKAEMKISDDPTSPLPEKRRWRDGEGIYLLSCTSMEFNQLVRNARRLDPTNSEQGRMWRQAVALGQDLMVRADVGLDALTREESLWRQGVPVGGENSMELRAGRPSFGERKGSAPLVGEEALQFMQSMLGTGQIVRVPLWHSGIWVDLKAPTEAQLLELDRRIANEKILLGRATNGLAYSNMSVYHNSFLFNFALSMVFNCSIENYSADRLKELILLPDLPQLLWGLLLTIYPNGYRYHRPCINDPSACTHVTEALLNISKLSWTDINALSAGQRDHMKRRTAKFTELELKNFRNQHRFVKLGTVKVKELGGNITTVELRVPTLGDYERSGFSWIEGIVSGTDQAFGSQFGAEERNDYILEQARVSSLRQYAHWIERITFNSEGSSDEQKVIEDRSTVEMVVGQLTGDSEVFENLLEGVRKFINEATVSQIALPNYKCPVCQKDQHDPEETRHPHLIPLDIGAVFFTLLGQRVTLLLNNSVI